VNTSELEVTDRLSGDRYGLFNVRFFNSSQSWTFGYILALYARL